MSRPAPQPVDVGTLQLVTCLIAALFMNADPNLSDGDAIVKADQLLAKR